MSCRSSRGKSRLGERPPTHAVAPREEPADHREVGEVEGHARGEGRHIGAVRIAHRSREPAPHGDAGEAAAEPDRDPPTDFPHGEELADDEDVGRHDAAETETEEGCTREEADLVVGEKEGGTAGALAGRAREDAGEAADAVAEPSPELPADEG